MTSEDEHEIVRAVTRLETKMEHVDEQLISIRDESRATREQLVDLGKESLTARQQLVELRDDNRKVRSMLWRIMWVLLVSLLGIVLKSTGLAPLVALVR